jgi:hypothetical protein
MQMCHAMERMFHGSIFRSAALRSFDAAVAVQVHDETQLVRQCQRQDNDFNGNALVQAACRFHP